MPHPRSIVAVATIAVAMSASPSSAASSEGPAPERKTLMAFSGGGIYAHTAHTSLIRGLLNRPYPFAKDGYAPTSTDLEALFSRTHTITANSGGTWLMTHLAYSPEFENALLLHADRKGWNSPDGYLGQMTRFPEAIIPTDFPFPADEVADVLNEFVPDIVRFDYFDYDWSRINREWVFGPFNMGTNITAVVKPTGQRNTWADDVNLIWAAGLPAHVAGGRRLGSYEAEAMLYNVSNSPIGYNYTPSTRISPDTPWLCWTYDNFPLEFPAPGSLTYRPFGAPPYEYTWSSAFEEWFNTFVSGDALSHPFEPLTIGSPSASAFANDPLDFAEFFARNRAFHYSWLRNGPPFGAGRLIPANVDYRALSVIDAAAISSSAIGPFASDGVFEQSLWANAGVLCEIPLLDQLCGGDIRDWVMTEIFPARDMDINLEVNASNELLATPNSDLDAAIDPDELLSRNIFSAVDGVWVDDLGVAHMIRDLSLSPAGLSASLDDLAQDIDHGGYQSNNPQLVIFEASNDIVVADEAENVFMPKNTAKLFGASDAFRSDHPHTNSEVPTSDTKIFDLHPTNPFPYGSGAEVQGLVNSFLTQDERIDHHYVINTFFYQAVLAKNSMYGVSPADVGKAIDVTVIQVQFVDGPSDDLHQSMSGILLPLTNDEFEYLGNMTTAVSAALPSTSSFVNFNCCPSRKTTCDQNWYGGMNCPEWRDHFLINGGQFFIPNPRSAYELLQRALGSCPPGSLNIVDPGCGCDCIVQDSDKDGIPDHLDQCPGFPDNQDLDGDGIPDACDDATPVTYDPAIYGDDLKAFIDGLEDNGINNPVVTIPPGLHLLSGTIVTDSITIVGDGPETTSLVITSDAMPARFFDAKFLTLRNLSLVGGEAPPGESGGAVRLTGSSFFGFSSGSFTNVAFTGNLAPSGLGGAVSYETTSFGNIEFKNCIFAVNQAFFGGGAINLSGGGLATTLVEDCVFTDNSASFGGGAIRAEFPFTSVRDSLILGNRGGTFGGGIYSPSGGYLALNGSDLVANEALAGGPGGAVAYFADPDTPGLGVEINDTTICFNDQIDGDAASQVQVFGEAFLAVTGSACISTDCNGTDPNVPLRCDECPDDPDKLEPGDCGCGVPDVDTDADGVVDCLDECPNDSFKIVAGLCGCGTPEGDADFDGVPDCQDICPNHADWRDKDGDGIPDGCDPDTVYLIDSDDDLQYLLTIATSGQTVLLESGLYTGPLEITVPGLKILGAGTPEEPTMLVGAAGSVDPIIRIDTPPGGEPILLEGLTIDGGSSAGVGLVIAGGAAEASACSIFGCESDLGGVAVTSGSALRMSNCAVFDNVAATPAGGGIFVGEGSNPGTLELIATTVCGNLPTQVAGPATIDESSCLAEDCTDSTGTGLPDDCEGCIGDINGDGQVDAADLGLLIGAWDTDDADADINGDGNVDAADLGLVIGAWGLCA